MAINQSPEAIKDCFAITRLTTLVSFRATFNHIYGPHQDRIQKNKQFEKEMIEILAKYGIDKYTVDL